MDGLRVALTRLLKPSHIFRFQGRPLVCFEHPYNGTLNNERAVEVPIVMKYVDRHRGQSILEVGNVLSHYFDFPHDIVDKYEQADGVRNEDVLEFSPRKKYDLVVTISTLEHVGFDETPKNPDKILLAIDHLMSLLAPGGELVVTLPVGYNPTMDEQLRTGAIRFDELYAYLRVASKPRWIDVPLERLERVKYGEPFPFANGVVIGVRRA